MTTKQDYITSILQSLAGITLSNPSHESLAEIDSVIGEFRRKLAYEAGELDSLQVIELFQALVDTGLIFHLQGHYQCVASDLIRAGEIAL